MGKRHILLAFAAAALVCLCGCTVITKDGNEKVRDIDFTVLAEDNIPDELKQVIEEKKEKEFKLTYQDNGFLYICVGYGRQPTGGYSISVTELYETENAVYVHTNLLGPSAGENKAESPSYPYIVVKLEKTDKAVVFE